MAITIGILFISIAALHFVSKVYVSFTSEGGAIGMVPVLDGGVLPPLFVLFGINVIERESGWPGYPGWIYFVGWVAGTVFGVIAIIRVGEWGARCHRKKQD